MAKTKTKDKKKNKDKGSVKRGHKAPTGPIAPKMFSGLNEGRMKSGTGRFADRTELKQGDTVTLQFLTPITEFLEIDQHQFRDEGKWKYVPCGGDGCPLCADDDDEVSKQHYRFFANVYNFDTKRVEVFEGPKTLSQLIAARYKKSPKQFTSRTWDVSKMKTQPVTFDVDRGEQDVKSTKGMKLWDLKKNVIEQFNHYFGGNVNIEALEEKEDAEAESSLDDEVLTKKGLKKLDKPALKKVADNFGIKVKGKTPEEVIAVILKAQG